jgi:hypothetical protein
LVGLALLCIPPSFALRGLRLSSDYTYNNLSRNATEFTPEMVAKAYYLRHKTQEKVLGFFRVYTPNREVKYHYYAFFTHDRYLESTIVLLVSDKLNDSLETAKAYNDFVDMRYDGKEKMELEEFFERRQMLTLDYTRAAYERLIQFMDLTAAVDYLQLGMQKEFAALSFKNTEAT